MPKNHSTLFFILSWLLFAIFFMSANRVHVKKYSPYQLLSWEIKANEGYRSWWYRDGYDKKQGKPRYSIGFGWNDCGNISRRNSIKKYTADGKVTYSEALEITLRQINSYGKLHADPYKDLALKLYSYNCGRITSGKSLGKCHNGKNSRNKRCGHPNPDVRKHHNARREYELALWRHDWVNIQDRTEENIAKVKSQLISVRGR